MNLFRQLGRRAERLKRQIEDGAEEARVCADCEERFAEARDACPSCGSEDVAVLR